MRSHYYIGCLNQRLSTRSTYLKEGSTNSKLVPMPNRWYSICQFCTNMESITRTLSPQISWSRSQLLATQVNPSSTVASLINNKWWRLIKEKGEEVVGPWWSAHRRSSRYSISLIWWINNKRDLTKNNTIMLSILHLNKLKNLRSRQPWLQESCGTWA